MYVPTSILSYFSNPPKHIKKPLLFNSNYFSNDKEIIDIYLGYQSTRIVIVNKKENEMSNNNDNDDEKKSDFIWTFYILWQNIVFLILTWSKLRVVFQRL